VKNRRSSFSGRAFAVWTRREAGSTASQADRARALLASANKKAEEAPELIRPGISTPIRTRFAIRAKPSEWLFADAGRAVVDAIFECIKDGYDRAVLTWPEPPGGAFVAACLALREARGTGRLAHATFGYWPWRDGATWAARLVLVNPRDIAAAARAPSTTACDGMEEVRPRAWIARHDRDQVTRS